MFGILAYLGLQTIASIGNACRDAESRRRTDNGLTYMKHRGGSYLSSNNHRCYYYFLGRLSDGTWMPLGVKNIGNARPKDYVLIDDVTKEIVRNFTAEQRAARGEK